MFCHLGAINPLQKRGDLNFYVTAKAKVLKPPQREAHFQQKCSRRYSGSTTFAGHLSRPLEPLGKIIDQKCSPRHNGKPTFDKSAHGTTTGEGRDLGTCGGATTKQALFI